MEDTIKCPKCGSTQLTTNKKGFSGSKAAAGVILTGGIGLLAGTIGSNKVIITCLMCGKQFKAGEYNKEKEIEERERAILHKVVNGEESFINIIVLFLIFSLIGIFIAYKLFSNDWGFLGFVFTIATIICLIITIFAIYSEITRKDQQKGSTQSSIKRKEDTVSQPKRKALRSSPQKPDKTAIDDKIKNYLKHELYLDAIDYCRINTNSTYEEAKNYVVLIASKMSEQNHQ